MYVSISLRFSISRRGYAAPKVLNCCFETIEITVAVSGLLQLTNENFQRFLSVLRCSWPIGKA